MSNFECPLRSPAARRRDATRRLVMDAFFAALYFVFARFVSIDTPIVQISFSSFPIIFCALMLGTRDALLVAFVGSYLEQVTSPYGLSPTTPLWMLPVILLALFAALFGRLLPRPLEIKKTGRLLPLLVIILCGELLLTVTNTAALYIDGWVMHYPVKALDAIALTRLINCAVRAAINCVVLPLLLPPVQKMYLSRKHQ